MKIAVTAASGRLGGAIIQYLVDDVGPENIVGLARTPEKAQHLGVEIRKGDYNRQEDFEQGLKDVETVLIVSSMAEPEQRIQQHRNVIEAAKTNGVLKIVYTSIIGDPSQTAFSPVIKSNRQTEEDVKASGLEWVIGRNGLYIEPDLEYIDEYVKEGAIRNCAGDGLCAYTSRTELACAYARMMLENQHHGQTYNLVGEPITQQQLADLINQVYGTQLTYESIPVDEFIRDRQHALGAFLGTIIGGIYEGIRNGVFNPPSGFEKAAGRPHQLALEMIRAFKEEGA